MPAQTILSVVISPQNPLANQTINVLGVSQVNVSVLFLGMSGPNSRLNLSVNGSDITFRGAVGGGQLTIRESGPLVDVSGNAPQGSWKIVISKI